VWRATYRLQLTPESGFAHAREALSYLHALGISHLYLSPVFSSRDGSTHGYDVVDHGQIDEQLGGRAAFDALAAAGRELGMGIVLDIVPNHMAVLGAGNQWWTDVLENGPASRFASYFDIDWEPVRSSMRNRLLVPVLAAPLGEVIDRGEIRVEFQPEAGAFSVRYGGHQLPVEPRAYPLVFRAADPPLQVVLDGEAAQELSSLLDAFAALPPPLSASDELLQIRNRDRQVNQRRLARLCERKPDVLDLVTRALERINTPGSDLLAGLLEVQPYRLAFWRVSGEEINYRRFFDVNELAALRMEEPQVFAATHSLVRELWLQGAIDGLRVDHADGLYDPQAYLAQLRDLLAAEGGKRPWIVVEKILASGEKLPTGWSADGTTGYEFGALVTAWLVHSDGVAALDRTWQRFTGRDTAFSEIAYESRKFVMSTSLAAEISMLAARLDRLAQMHRNTSDFTLFDLRDAIAEVIACFPVYRTYIAADRLSAEDVQQVRRAVGAAFSRRRTAHRALEFLEQVLLGELSNDPLRASAALDFTRKFQQVTSPVMAKGVEDTAFYRFARLLAFNEVGADPDALGISTELLHRANEARARDWPRTMISTATHDSKRGEDVRFRLCVLSELAPQWTGCVWRWRRLKRRRRGADAPGAVQEYLLLQSLLGIWPAMAGEDPQGLRPRLAEYAVKAAREAKEETSWLEQDDEAEAALQDLVAQMLPAAGMAGFERYFRPVIDGVAYFGMLNSLSAVTLKLTAPGVPDIYQGCELPALVLVDPDNRRAVDFGRHAAALDSLQQRLHAQSPAAVAGELLARWQDGQLKLFITATLLRLRQSHAAACDGQYLALGTSGVRAEHICAYARVAEASAFIVVVSRWSATLSGGALQAPLGEQAWADTAVLLPRTLPAGIYVDVFTGQQVPIGSAEEESRLGVASLFTVLPVCVLARQEAM